MTQWRTKGRTPDVSFPSTPSTKVYRLAGCGRLSTAPSTRPGASSTPCQPMCSYATACPICTTRYTRSISRQSGRLKAAMRRLIFHELFLIQAGLAARKARVERTESRRQAPWRREPPKPFLQGLPFGRGAGAGHRGGPRRHAPGEADAPPPSGRRGQRQDRGRHCRAPRRSRRDRAP